MISATLLLACASHAQAANNHSTPWKFGVIDGLGTPLLYVFNPRSQYVYTGTPGDRLTGPDWKTQFEENLTNGDKWTSNTDSQETTQWTTQTDSRP